MSRRKRKNRIVAGIKPAIGLGVASIGAGALSGPLGSKLPAGSVNPLAVTASTTSRFVGPAAAIGATGVVLSELKKAQPKLKGRKR